MYHIGNPLSKNKLHCNKKGPLVFFYEKPSGLSMHFIGFLATQYHVGIKLEIISLTVPSKSNNPY